MAVTALCSFFYLEALLPLFAARMGDLLTFFFEIFFIVGGFEASLLAFTPVGFIRVSCSFSL